MGGGVDEAVAEVTQGGAVVQAGQQLFDPIADSRAVVHLVGIGTPTLAAGTALTLPAAVPPAPAPPPTFSGATMTLAYPALAGQTEHRPEQPGDPGRIGRRRLRGQRRSRSCG